MPDYAFGFIWFCCLQFPIRGKCTIVKYDCRRRKHSLVSRRECYEFAFDIVTFGCRGDGAAGRGLRGTDQRHVLIVGTVRYRN